MTAQTAPFTLIERPRAISWRFCAWLTRGAAAILARVGLAFALIVVGGVLAPLLASETLQMASSVEAVACLAPEAMLTPSQGE